jgi:hypothetical protein
VAAVHVSITCSSRGSAPGTYGSTASPMPTWGDDPLSRSRTSGVLRSKDVGERL